MESIVTILSGSATLGSLALVAYLVVKLIGMSEQLSDARQAQYTTEEHLEEANFKLAQVQQALTSEQTVAAAEAKELSANDAKPINTDLAPDDVAGRIQRLFASWAVSDASARAASAASAAVPSPAVPAAPGGNPGK